MTRIKEIHLFDILPEENCNNMLKLKKPLSIFDYGVLIMIIKVCLSYSSFLYYNELIDTTLSLIATALFCLCIISDSYSAKTLIIYGIMGGLLLLTAIVTKNFGFLITGIVCFALRKRDFNRFVDLLYEYERCFLVIHTILAVFLATFHIIDFWKLEKGMLRATMGFGNPNTFSSMVFNLCLMDLWINYYKNQRYTAIKLLVIIILTVSFTKTRTILIDGIVLIMLYLSATRFSIKKFLSRTAGRIIPILTLFTWGMIALYIKGNKIAFTIDKWLTARIKLGAYAYIHKGISLCGQNLMSFNAEWDSIWQLNHFTFDNIYTYLACNQGYIWIVILSILFYCLSKFQNNRINLMLVLWALYGITEVHGLNGFMCMPIFLIVFLFPEKRNTLYCTK